MPLLDARSASAAESDIAPFGAERAGRLEAILHATGVFSPDEIRVARELLEDAAAHDGGRGSASHQSSPPPYSFLGSFTPDGELVGFACYGPTPGTDRTYDLYWIAVDPARGRAGFASLLIEEVERRLQGQTARLLVVETSSRSDYLPARRFYARRGYAEAARVAGFYAPDDDRIILTKRIHSPEGRGARSP
ncbi:MAG TPA: GNAT family N-acetyltransferase [Gemmatimonadaceae bacterium]|nr:GNAT family N-acetyltransferase [Gemmatimonadaceae bacterium]